MRQFLLSLVTLLFLIPSTLFGATLPAGFSEVLVAQGLDPTDLVTLHDGRIFITIKSGTIVVIEGGTLRSTPLLNITDRVDNFNERGLGHILLDPNFDTNGYFYLYYTVKGQNHNRLSRFTATGNASNPTSELILFDFDVVPGTIHNGGDMAIGKDGKLYVSSGEGANPNASQSLISSLGKVLRLNLDGTVPSDNPFVSQAVGKYQAIYALGFRNPYSLDVDLESGNIYSSDVGGSDWEEVNKVEAGKNYGWPLIEGKRVAQGIPSIGTYADPLYAYPHGGGVNAGCAVIGATVYRPMMVQFPAAYTGKVFFADYCNGYIKYLDPAHPEMPETFATNVDRAVAFAIDHSGNFYYIARGGLGGGSETDNTSSNNGTLWKVSYNGTGAPVVAVPPQSVLAAVGESASFTVQASGTAPLTYQWLVNGTPVTDATQVTFTMANVQLADDQKKISVKVTNAAGNATSTEATLTVTNNQRPTPDFTFSLSNGGELYQGASIITVNGTATDPEDGALVAADFSWTIHFHHDTHFHPALGPVEGLTQLAYEVPKVGETSANVWYRIYLTVKDHGNPSLTKTIFKDIMPLKSNITLTTVPSKLSLLLDGQTVQTPITFPAVVNMTRAIEVPASQFRNDTTYTFKNWADDSPRAITFDVPATNKTFTATLVALPKGTGTGLMGEYYNVSKAFTGTPALTRMDPTINFNWAGGRPDPLINIDNFTVRWTGEVEVQNTEEYTFYMVGDDGYRVWVNNTLIIDKWIDQAATEANGKVALEKGKKYPIKVEYYEAGGDAVAIVYWSSASLQKQVIPASQFYSSITTGIGDEQDQLVKVYPTVFQKTLNVKYNGEGTPPWMMMDMVGRPVLSGVSSSEFTIDGGGLSAGLYLFRIGDRTVRVIKN